jgi:hypothetical protein
MRGAVLASLVIGVTLSADQSRPVRELIANLAADDPVTEG